MTRCHSVPSEGRNSHCDAGPGGSEAEGVDSFPFSVFRFHPSLYKQEVQHHPPVLHLFLFTSFYKVFRFDFSVYFVPLRPLREIKIISVCFSRRERETFFRVLR